MQQPFSLEVDFPGSEDPTPEPDAQEEEKLAIFSASPGVYRRSAVSAAPVTTDQLNHWRGPPVHYKSLEETERIKCWIRQSQSLQVIFGHLLEPAVDKVVSAMFIRATAEGECIIQQGADGDYFYLVDSGAYDIYVQRQADVAPDRVLTAFPGMGFGELALMYNVPRAATVMCTEAGMLWCLERDVFRMMLITDENTTQRQYESFLSQIDMLRALNSYERGKLSDLLTREEFGAGQEIVRQGDQAEAIYFLHEGECKAYMHGPHGEVEVKHYCHPGDFFGEVALVAEQPRAATVRASGEGCTVLRLRRELLDLSVGAMRERLQQDISRYPMYEAFVADHQ